ncbi:MAG: ribosome biogenesis factor YjgA [Burkholderiales bacterium]
MLASRPEHPKEDSDKPSKTQMKQVMTDLQALGERMVLLNTTQIAAIEMPDFLREAVLAARAIKSHGGRRRQMQYIGKLMREVNAGPIREKISQWDGQSASNVAHEHAIERWRARLLAEDNAFTEFARTYPGANIGQLRALVRNANAERAAGKPPKSYRELFKRVREILDDALASGKDDSADLSAENES